MRKMLGCSLIICYAALRAPSHGYGIASRPRMAPRMLVGGDAGLTQPVAVYREVTIASPAEGPPQQEITVVDLMPHISSALADSGLQEGSVNIISMHTTCAITINEWESRLARDLRAWLLRLAPPDDRSMAGSAGAGVAYEHNDLELRPESDDERQRESSSLRRNLQPIGYIKLTVRHDQMCAARQAAWTTAGMYPTRRCCSVGATRSRSMPTLIWRRCSSVAARPSPSRAASSC